MSQVQLLGHVLSGPMHSHTLPTPHPDLQRLMRPSDDGTGQVINACSANVTLITLTGRFVLIATTFHAALGITTGTRSSCRPAQLAHAIVTWGFSNHILAVTLQQFDSSHGFEKGLSVTVLS